MLYLAPHLVRMDLAEDYMMSRDELRRYRRGWLKVPRSSSSGSIGRPTLATAGEGRRDLRAHPREGPREGLPDPRAGHGLAIGRRRGRRRYIVGTLHPVASAPRRGDETLRPTPPYERVTHSPGPLPRCVFCCSPRSPSSLRRAALAARLRPSTTAPSGRRRPSRSTRPSRSPGGTTPSTSSRPTTAAPPTPRCARRGARCCPPPTPTSARGTSRAASRCSTASRSATARDAIQSSYGLNLNYRVNSATFVNPKAAVANRDAVDADITGSGEQLRAAVTQQYLSVLQAQARCRAAGHAGEHGRRRSSSWRKAKLAVGSGHLARHPPRRGGARTGAGRAAHGAEQRRGREAAPLPADGRRAAAGRVS